VPGFEFNSLRRWLSPVQFEELFPCAVEVAEPFECFGFGEPERSRRDLRLAASARPAPSRLVPDTMRLP